MRKWNAITSLLLVFLLVVHLFMGAFIMMDIIQVSPIWKKSLSYFMVGLLILHMIFGIVLTIKSIKNTKQSGASYNRLNKRFWVARISGFSIIILALYHIWFFIRLNSEAVRLKPFGIFQLIASLLLVIALLVHIITNIRPMIISFGAEQARKFAKDTMIVILMILMVGVVAFIIYYFRWNIWWQ